MITFKENKLVIEVETFSPSETLYNYQNAIINVVKMATSGDQEIQRPEHIHFLLDLLEQTLSPMDEVKHLKKQAS